MSLQADCIFCKILKGEIPSQKIFENEKVFAFRDLHPQAKEHILVIPKFHTNSLAHLEKHELNIMTDMYQAALEIADKQGFRQKGFRTVINTGQEGGQTVFHLHMHVLAGSQMGPRFG
jgi:histidine triad (HIT) family protein